MVRSQLDLPYFFVKGSKLTEVKPFFHGISPQHSYYIHMRKSKKITKDNNNFK